MPSMIYNSAKADLMSGAFNFASDTWKVMLVDSSYLADKSHSRRSDITGEVRGTGYVAGGKLLTGLRVVQDDKSNEGVFDADDAVWTVARITARGAVIYKSRGGSPSADELLCYFDFLADQVSSGGNFEISWNAHGIMAIG